MQRGIEPRRRSKSIPLPKSVDLNRTALLLDVDGTLLDIASTPDGVVVPASLNATLERLLAQTGGTVALVSGRTIPTLDRLFHPLKLPAIGGHGAEMRFVPEASVVRRHPPGLSDAIREKLHALAEIGEKLVLGLAEHRRAADLKRVAVLGVEHLFVLHCQPPAEGVDGAARLLRVLGEQVEVIGNARDRFQLADADELHPVIGLDDDAGHSGVGGDAVNHDVLPAQNLAEPPRPRGGPAGVERSAVL